MPAVEPAQFQDLDTPFKLTDQQIRSFRENGYVKLKHVLSAETLKHYGDEITRQVLSLNKMTKPMSERTTYQKAFLQIMNLWMKSEVAKEFVFGKRLGQIAAELMGVRGVRLYHDQALYKESGGGFTPWHADQYYWPLSNEHSCTVWIPLQSTPKEMGPLAFARRSHQFKFGRDLEISDASETKLQASLAEQGFPLDEEPFDLGEVSYHYGWTFHRAGPNTTNLPRAVMTIIYIEDGIQLAEPVNKNQFADWDTWMAGTKIGEVVQTQLNPLIYTA